MNIDKLDVEQKFAKVIIDLRQIRPFYSAVFESMTHVENEEIDTVAVTSSEILYNKKYVDSISYEEFLFAMAHEICHIALMHVPRSKNKVGLIMNIACDLYVNKLLSDEFGIYPGQFDSTNKIKMPHSLVYCSSIDTENEVVENIYNSLIEQAEKQGYMSGNSTGEIVLKYTGTLKSSRSYSDEESFKIYKDFEYTLDDSKYTSDLIDDGLDESMSEDTNKAVIQEAVTREQMIYGSSLNKASDVNGILREISIKILESKLDWRKLLKKYCRKYRNTDSSFAVPDKRMYYQKAIYPGQVGYESLVLKNVKVCIDTSGSMSEKDLGYILGQVMSLTKQFKVSAEMILWDTNIYARYLLEDNKSGKKDINPTKVNRFGGTDASCLFEYFDSKECKVKPIVTLIFTDGYLFNELETSYRKKYKDTIWVMTRDYNKQFKPPFGKLVVADFN